MTNVSNEREIFEIDVGDPLESERSFCRDSSMWLSKRLSDGNRARLPITVSCQVNNYNSMKQ